MSEFLTAAANFRLAALASQTFNALDKTQVQLPRTLASAFLRLRRPSLSALGELGGFQPSNRNYRQLKVPLGLPLGAERQAGFVGKMEVGGGGRRAREGERERLPAGG